MFKATLCYSFAKCLRTREISGNRNRNSCGLFSPITSMDVDGATGDTARLTYLRFLTSTSTSLLKNNVVRFLISIRSNRNA